MMGTNIASPGRALLTAGMLVLAVHAVASPSTAAPAEAPAAVPAPHERLLPLHGGRNFRDLGGYRTVDGRKVKWGLLFRSGSMHGLTDADYQYLEGRGLTVVCDFRDRRERASEPVAWPGSTAPRVLSEDYDLDMHFLPAGDPRTLTEADARAAMTASYPRLLAQFNGQYRRMFAELLAGHAPLAFNCSAGKDRTGIAAALLLTALGVPRAAVIDDYLLTNRYLDPAALIARSRAPNPANPMAGLSDGAAKALIAADRAYIEAAFAVVDRHPGGPKGYLRDELGLPSPAVARLRDLYLERS